MTQRYRRTFITLAASAMIALPVAATAQQQQQESQRPGSAKEASRDTQVLVAHGLSMAIDASRFSLDAQHVALTSMMAKSRVQTDPGPDERALAQGGQEVRLVDDLIRHAREAAEAADELLTEASEQARGEDPDARDLSDQSGLKRAIEASRHYVETLDALCGTGSDSDTPGQGAGTAKLSASGLTAVTLINHSVKESIDAFTIHSAARMRSGRSDSAEKLREHASEMFSHCQEELSRLAEQLQQDAEQADDASPHQLAVRGREVARTFAELANAGR